MSVTALGSLEGRDPVLRSGARPGDLVAVAGRLGWAAAGFAVLSRGFRSPRTLVDAHRRPAPPYAEGPRAATLGATAMVDVSDGLVSDLGHVARASGVALSLSSDAFHVPQEFQDTARALNADPMHWLLGRGRRPRPGGVLPAGRGPADGLERRGTRRGGRGRAGGRGPVGRAVRMDRVLAAG